MLCIQQELFDEHSDATRWARKPRFMLDKGHGQVIRLFRFADAFKYIEAQTPVAAHRIVIDIDRDVRAITRCNDWWQLLDVPTPSYVLLNAENGHAHVFYELETAVATHDAARTAPLRYLAAIEAALRVALGGDVGYAGFICKNPHSQAWELHRGRRELYSLPELADYLTLPRLEDLKREPSGFGRNCTLFDGLRQWAYRAVGGYREGTVEAWSQAVYDQAMGLNSITPQRELRLLPVVSQPDGGPWLEMLWQLCWHLQRLGYPVVVLDGTAPESHHSPGLAQLLGTRPWSGAKDLNGTGDDASLAVLPAARSARVAARPSRRGMPRSTSQRYWPAALRSRYSMR